MLAKSFLSLLNDEIRDRKSKEYLAEWDYVTNITTENDKRRIEIATENAKYIKVRN